MTSSKQMPSFPIKLKPGDTVDIVLPSSAPQNKNWVKGLQILKSWKLKPRFSKKSLDPHLFHSHTNKQRSLFLNRAFARRDSSAVWLLRGGYGLQKLMPSFMAGHSPSLMKKLFIGYSDGTALHLYLNGQNQASLHAPTLSDLPHVSLKELSSLKNILFGEKKEITFKNLSCFRNFPSKNLKACIRGGNLSLLSSSLGTGWFPSFSSCFLFVEDVNEEDYKVDRMLSHLFYSGALKSVQAVLFGHFKPLNKNRLNKVLKSFSEICSIPLIFNLPCGHQSPNHPLPLNCPAKLSLQGSQAVLNISLR